MPYVLNSFTTATTTLKTTFVLRRIRRACLMVA